MRRDISLDPDYVPYELKLVKLRSKRKRRPWWLIIVLVVVALGFGVYQKESTRARANATMATLVVMSTPTPGPGTNAITATPCPVPVGESGKLTLAYHDGCASTRIACHTYMIGTRIGTTGSAPVVPIEGDVITLMCDDTQIEFVIP